MNKKKIEVCLGSSCYTKGSTKLVKIIENYIEEKKLNAEFELRGCLCKGKCMNGPVVIIDGKEYVGVTEDKILKILEE
jgi:NADH:ubiquinone oxidoreductase subunit E